MKLLNTLFFFLFLGLCIYILLQIGQNTYLHKNIWLIYVFFVAVSFFGFRLISLGFENNREKFVIFFMANMVLRLILSLFFLGYFVYTKTENIQLFAINFIVLYLCALLFEIFEISRNL